MRACFILIALAIPLSASAQKAIRIAPEPEPVIGVLHAPLVSVIITRKNLDAGYDLLLRESFLPRIVEAVEQDPF